MKADTRRTGLQMDICIARYADTMVRRQHKSSDATSKEATTIHKRVENATNNNESLTVRDAIGYWHS
jgi:hypothetical protein